MKNRLIDLLYEGEEKCEYTDCGQCDYLGCESCGFHIIADHLIANGVRLEEKQATSDESKWISVKDRLPDTAERVLVCKTWLGRVYKPEYGYYQDFPNRKGCWYVLTEFGYYPQREVTHWMPLPQPPKGEQQ